MPNPLDYRPPVDEQRPGGAKGYIAIALFIFAVGLLLAVLPRLPDVRLYDPLIVLGIAAMVGGLTLGVQGERDQVRNHSLAWIAIVFNGAGLLCAVVVAIGT